MASVHQPVLLQELIDSLALTKGSVVVDGTLGGAGHARKVAERLGEDGTFIGIDADSDAISRAKESLKGVLPKVHLIEDNFRNLSAILKRLDVQEINALILDLGLSSDQLEQSGRGFSFRGEEQLLMTFATEPNEGDTTASDVVNFWSEEHIADILHGFGEERFAKRIARAIVKHRDERPINTAGELARIVEGAVPLWYRRRKIHPATRTFQAVRMAVNDELGALREGLTAGMKVLAPHGRIAVITFHSVEDRVVKTFFHDLARGGKGSLVYKKPVTPTPEEIARNPRARSAKLRVFEKAPL